MKIVSIVGARPQFIKAWPVSRALRQAGHTEILVHTGQHYDDAMSRVFFEELGLPEPDVNLGIGSGSHGEQTGRMLVALEPVLLQHRPDWVLVYGDTNSTLAGALAAAKLHLPLAHVEAGLRSFNKRMPEEINRVLTDHCSDLLFCPTQTAVENLAREGITRGVHLVGDVMHEALLEARQIAAQRSRILDQLGLEPRSYFLVTVHRAENTDEPTRLAGIWSALTELARERPVLFPVHPRTRKVLTRLGLSEELAHLREPDCADGDLPVVRPVPGADLRLLPPLGYLDMLRLTESARVILTDSGGLQKEAWWLGVPCVTLRDETEWVETLAHGANVLAGTEPTHIERAISRQLARPTRQNPQVPARASGLIATLLGRNHLS
ncbi:non-hydrolyzing UDP-N-acetylglucosamine 2-epimerase [Limisphaera sp. VF-2]|uniref:non-hydrolyzing UDP-N-acetylglucosamine 2-epimerase n=1 Tax=Limisphaera sp. VF-2 TaxID=3400418 RepID=UPI003C1FE499